MQWANLLGIPACGIPVVLERKALLLQLGS